MMLNYKLTDTEIGQALGSSHWGSQLDRAVADAAAEKALRTVVAWLRADATTSCPDVFGKAIIRDIASMLERIMD